MALLEVDDVGVRFGGVIALDGLTFNVTEGSICALIGPNGAGKTTFIDAVTGFVPSTGRDYELKQNIFRDDRRDVLASTRAALDYMQKLYAMFGDWQLALAAYNWGEGSVQKAVARNQKAGLPTDYASLRMPAETQWYLPKLQAVKNIISRPGDFGLQLPPLYNHPYFLSVPIEHDMDVAIAAKIAGMPLDEFQNLNPQMNRPVILAAGTKGKRYALPHAKVMIHQPFGGIWGQTEDIAIQAQEILKTKKTLSDLLAKLTGQPPERIAEDQERDHYFDAHEAKAYGLVDEVLEEQDKAKKEAIATQQETKSR